jgi:hypothetical protein
MNIRNNNAFARVLTMSDNMQLLRRRYSSKIHYSLALFLITYISVVPGETHIVLSHGNTWKTNVKRIFVKGFTHSRHGASA